MGKLVLVPTPIGNLDDITIRALQVLKSCDVILAEDTRVTKRLLSHFNILKPIKSYHINNEHKVLDKFLQEIQKNNLTVLVSDAGTPGISDPGFLIVRSCIEQEIKVEVLPGPTAFVPALVGSGLPCDSFIFEGFLPHKKGRHKALEKLSKESRTLVLYESPHRLVKLLEQMIIYFEPNRRICVVRELTKVYETYNHGTLEELRRFYTEADVKGEIVVIVEGIK